jgi:cyclohexanone monooxygenase
MSAPDAAPHTEIDALVVGAGFAGLYMLHRLRGMGMSVRVIEAGAGVGGTWYWNRYPGARCDVESVEYSYGFSEELQQQWQWSERFAAQPEILRYLEHVAERFGLYPDIQLNTRVLAAHFDAASARWRINTDNGNYHARYCVMATGCLSSANRPDMPGLADYQGRVLYTSHWPHEEVSFAGQRVGLIGTGSSGVQATPEIAKQAAHLYVFQRTANWSIPARNTTISADQVTAVKSDYRGFRARQRKLGAACHLPPNKQSALAIEADERNRIYEHWWALGGLSFLGAFGDLIFDQRANDTAADFIRAKILATVRDPAVAAKLIPEHSLGCKRACSDSNYYETFNRGNVTLVDIHTAPLQTFTTSGLRTAEADYALDAVVFATGFDAMTGALDRIDIHGSDGQRLKDKWAAGPRTYLGLATAGFPNFFIITGPGSPSVLASMTVGIEHHVEWIAQCIDWLGKQGATRIEVEHAAEEAWVEHVNTVAGRTLMQGCNSWYMGANIPGKPRVFLPYVGGFPRYEAKCSDVAAKGYEGFKLA